MATYFEYNEGKPHFDLIEWDDRIEIRETLMDPLTFRQLFLERYTPRPEDVVEWK